MASAHGPQDPPLDRLEQMLDRDLGRLTERRTELAEVGDALMALRAQLRYGPGVSGSIGVEVLDQEVAAPVIDRLAGRVDRVDNVFLDAEVGAGTDSEHAQHELDRVRAGQRQRTLYHQDVLDVPEHLARVDALHAVGQEQRVLDVEAHEFAIFGREAVVTPSVWGDAGAQYLVIRQPVLVGIFRSWFDVVWERSPLFGVDDPLDERLVALLALGYKDETIARHLGVALRTVRRRVAALMEHHRVATRFQLGVALARAGQA